MGGVTVRDVDVSLFQAFYPESRHQNCAKGSKYLPTRQAAALEADPKSGLGNSG